MRFTLIFCATTTAALMLAGCSGGESAAPEGAASEEASASAADATDEAKDTVAADETGEASADKTDPKAAKAGTGDTWTCEDRGDAEVTFVSKPDGTAQLITKSASEMAANDPPIVINLEATGASAGYEDRSGRMSDSTGATTVWFLKDGRVEVTEGEGDARESYFCTQ